MYEKKPWLKFYGSVPQSIDYPRVTMYQALMDTAGKYPDTIAYDFLGYTSTYRRFAEEESGPGSAGGYVVDHSSSTYVVDPSGRLVATLQHGTAPAEVVKAIRAAMQGR